MNMNVPAEYLIFKINIYKKMLLAIAAISLTALFLGQKGFAMGFFVGGALALAVFSLLYKYVLTLRGLQPAGRKKFIIPRALLIYFIMGAALAIGMKKGIPAFLGTAAGIFALKVTIFIQAFQEKNVRE